MDRLDKMNQQQLYDELKNLIPRFNELVTLVGEVKVETRSIKESLIGTEYNNFQGLVSDFNLMRTDLEKYKEKTDKRLEKVEHYKTGMKWGVGIIAFITTSTIFIKFTDGLKWIWESLFK